MSETTRPRLHSENLAEALKIAIEVQEKEERSRGMTEGSCTVAAWKTCLDALRHGVLPYVDWAHGKWLG